jgi:hypothetical protein
MVRCLNPSRSKRYFSPPKYADGLWVPSNCQHSGYLGVSPGLKRLGLNLGHSPPSVTAAKNEWSFTSAPTDCFRGVDTHNFTFFYQMKNGQAGYVPCIRQKRTACRILVGKHRGRGKVGRSCK